MQAPALPTAFIAATVGFAASASASMWGISSSSPGQLYTIDLATGAATSQVVLSEGTSFSGLDYFNGQFYATDIFNPAGGFAFGSIDPFTGTVTILSDQDGSFNWWGLANDGNTMYTVDRDAGDVLKAVAPDGTTTTIGSTGINDIGSGLAYDPSGGMLWAIGFDGNVYTIDPSNAATTLVGPTGLSFNQVGHGLEFDPTSGILYFNEADSTDSLYTIDLGTGAATLVGSNGAVAGIGIDGLAWVPTPGAAALFGIAGLAATRRRRA